MQISAQLQNAKVLLGFLKVINFKDDVNFILSANGMKMTVEESSVFQANAFLQKEVFRYFHFPHDDNQEDDEDNQQEFVFRIQLSSMIDCLSLFSGATGAGDGGPVLCFKYVEDESLQMWLEEGGVIVEINAKIKAPMHSVDFDFVKRDISAKVILGSEKIKDVLADLDGSSETVLVSIQTSWKSFFFSYSYS
jgi:hypothetical protein